MPNINVQKVNMFTNCHGKKSRIVHTSGRKPKKSTGEGDYSPEGPSDWGQAISQDAQGRNNVFERTLSNGQVLITHVLWAI